MKVAFIDPTFNHVRCLLPAHGLSSFGSIDAACFPAFALKQTGQIVPVGATGKPIEADHPWDVIVFVRARNVAEVTENARNFGQLVVQDLDDHFWAFDRNNTARLDWDQKSLIEYEESLRAASLVTVATPFLADVVRDLGQPNVTVLRNMIDLGIWKRQPIRNAFETVGWVGTTDKRSQDLEQLGSSIRYLMRAHPDIGFIHGGHRDGNPAVAKILNIPSTRVERRPQVTIDKYPSLWDGIDVALCPLNPIPFNRAKSALKAMESSAAGVPFIATDLDSYRDFGQGSLVVKPDEWLQQLEAHFDRALRQEKADQAYERVRQEDVKVRWAEWEEAFAAGSAQ